MPQKSEKPLWIVEFLTALFFSPVLLVVFLCGFFLTLMPETIIEWKAPAMYVVAEELSTFEVKCLGVIFSSIWIWFASVMADLQIMRWESAHENQRIIELQTRAIEAERLLREFQLATTQRRLPVVSYTPRGEVIVDVEVPRRAISSGDTSVLDVESKRREKEASIVFTRRR